MRYGIIHSVQIPRVTRSTRMHCIFQNLDKVYSVTVHVKICGVDLHQGHFYAQSNICEGESIFTLEYRYFLLTLLSSIELYCSKYVSAPPYSILYCSRQHMCGRAKDNIYWQTFQDLFTLYRRCYRSAVKNRNLLNHRLETSHLLSFWWRNSASITLIASRLFKQ